MNKRVFKFVTILIIIITVILISNTVLASSGSGLVTSFNGDTSGAEATGGDGVKLIKKVIGPILNVIRIVATGISIIMITYLGIKYMAAAPNEKANIKSQLITFTIGAVVVIGAVSLLDIIKEAAGEIFG